MAKDPVNALVARIQKRFGAGSAAIMSAEGAIPSTVTEWIPTPLDAIDRHLLNVRDGWPAGQVGGLPVGRISEVYGPPGVGKTSFVYGTGAGCQALGGTVILAETEGATQPGRAECFGLDTSRVVYLPLDTIEAVLATLSDVSRNLGDVPRPIFMAWDTIAATPTAREKASGWTSKLKADGGAKGERIGERASLLSRALRALHADVRRERIHLCFVNQTRQGIGDMGPHMVTPGGEAVKFHASVRLMILGGQRVKGRGGEQIGQEAAIVATKNKLGAPQRRITARLLYEGRWDDPWTTLHLAKTEGFVGGRKVLSATTHEEALRALDWWAEPGTPAAEIRARVRGAGVIVDASSDDGDDNEEGDE